MRLLKIAHSMNQTYFNRQAVQDLAYDIIDVHYYCVTAASGGNDSEPHSAACECVAFALRKPAPSRT